STNVGLRIKKKISIENDYYHTLRTILRYLDKDISLAFHAYADTPIVQQSRIQAAKTNPLLTVYVPSSFFKGSKDKLFFTSSSHQRIYKDTNETDTCKISYYLESDPDNPGVYNLIKRESTFIDDKIEESGAKYIIASDIESMSFKYFSPTGTTTDGTWSDTWDSTEGDHLNTFPLAVEITITAISSENKDKKLKIFERIKLLNPNNLGSVTSFSQSSSTTTTQGGTNASQTK
ncbi:MAG: hypothetical protein NTY22_04280, partial [Proteobacteria bacterium]|nr:hypothetical protein [Pseudomonadota bacterium]